MKSVVIYIDESGDTSLAVGSPGVTGYYTITAIIVKKEEIRDFNSGLHGVFGDNEVKSSGIGSARRKQLIDGVSGLSFKYSSLIVDKALIIKSSGLSYKKSFIKWIHRRLYERFARLYGDIDIISDKHGRDSFMNECQSYYTKRVSYPIGRYMALPSVQQINFSYADSKDERGIQLADLISGTLRKIHEQLESADVMASVNSRCLSTEHWPQKWSSLLENEYDNDIDGLVQSVSLAAAVRFLEKHHATESESRSIECDVLRYLLDRFQYNMSTYVYADEMISYLMNSCGYADISGQKFKNIIGRLRTANVAIASNRRGYKIPNKIGDIETFVRKVVANVDPYIRRLGLLRDSLYGASLGECDILKSDNLHPIRRYLKLPE